MTFVRNQEWIWCHIRQFRAFERYLPYLILFWFQKFAVIWQRIYWEDRNARLFPIKLQ